MASVGTRTETTSSRSRCLALDRVPEPVEVGALAATARRAWGVPPRTKLALDPLCHRLGVELSVAPLEVPAGGAQGFHNPRPGGFLLEVDPEPRSGWSSVAPGLRAQLARHRTRFLVAHELAHTLFYEHGSVPRRRLAGSPREEVFCDEFSLALLVPDGAARELPFEPESALKLQRRFDVSLELATRGLASAHRGKGAAWLLLRRREETLIQWSSADGGLGSRLLGSVRRLAERAVHSSARHTVAHEGSTTALYLPQRQQVVVTWVSGSSAETA